jgi:Raf kinase inhibitor-like YbhB/YbcL family protein
MKTLFIVLSAGLLSMTTLVMRCKKNNPDKFALHSTELTATMTNAQYANDTGGCTGENKSPQLSWVNAPTDTKSFAVVIYDKDANAGAGFNHWLLIDIPAAITSLVQDAGNTSGANIPRVAIQTQTDAHSIGYTGICPPAGETHRYVITVYALRTASLGLPDNTVPAEVKAAIRNKSIDSARLTVKGKH